MVSSNSRGTAAPDASGVLHLHFSASGIDLAVAYIDALEVIAYAEPVPVPGTPAYVKGVINYGGRVCPVISVGAAAGRDEGGVSGRTRIIMVESPADNNIRIGLLADKFHGTVKLPAGSAGDTRTVSLAPGLSAAHGADITLLKPFDFLKGFDFLRVND